jgi:hypothetical protein
MIPDLFCFAELHFLVSRKVPNECCSYDRSEEVVTHAVTAIPQACHHQWSAWAVTLNPGELLQGRKYSPRHRATHDVTGNLRVPEK